MRDEMGKECECEERRIMIIRKQASRLHVVDLDSMGKRMSGLSDSLCRWKNRNRALVELAVWWLTGMNLTQSMSRLQQLVGDPTSESWWTSYSASLWYRSGFMWNSPRMYIWGRLSHLGWNLGVLISECKFRSVIGIHPSNHTRLSFGPSRIIIF